MLKAYNELTDKQKKLVKIMYSDHSNLEQYLYNFDGDRYSGRQYSPPSGVIHTEGIESTVPKKKVELNKFGVPEIDRAKSIPEKPKRTLKKK